MSARGWHSYRRGEVDHKIGQARNRQFTGAGNPAGPANSGMHLQSRDSLKDILRDLFSRRGILLRNVVEDRDKV
jgi:hypothetical protein